MPMRAVQLTGHGGMDKLAYRDDVPIPEPGAGEVRVEVSACGMNNTDVWVREGAYGTADDPGPFPPGGGTPTPCSSRASRAPTSSARSRPWARAWTKRASASA